MKKTCNRNETLILTINERVKTADELNSVECPFTLILGSQSPCMRCASECWGGGGGPETGLSLGALMTRALGAELAQVRLPTRFSCPA